MNRQQQIDEFYELIESIERKFHKRKLGTVTKATIPSKGVYFFFEKGEVRQSKHARIVRIGTHGVQAGSNATLYSRLYKHRGAKDYSGNNRSSVFRELIGRAIINQEKISGYPYWGDRAKKGDTEVKTGEKDLELRVSAYLRDMEFIILEVLGESSKDNDRAFIETNSIALLSNYQKKAIDAPSKQWLGFFTENPEVTNSGLWNRDEVKSEVNNELFERLRFHIDKMPWY